MEQVILTICTESFMSIDSKIHPLSAPHTSHSEAMTSKYKATVSRMAFMPPELQIQIITHLAEPSSDSECRFCHLFALSEACRVNKLWHHYAMKMLYTTIPLGFSLKSTCAKHHRLRSNHTQLGKRVPLLVQTLQNNPHLAEMVRSIEFPVTTKGCTGYSQGQLAYWVTCGMEKKWLPQLIRTCTQLESVDGLQDVLSELFNGEHFCTEACVGQEHGYLAQSLVERNTLKRWDWVRGSISKLDEQVAGEYDSFTSLHQNWDKLEHLGIVHLDGMTPVILEKTLEGLPALRSLTLSTTGKKFIGASREAAFAAQMLPSVPLSLEKLTLAGCVTANFYHELMEWVESLVEFRISSGVSHFCPAETITDILLQQPPARGHYVTEVAVSIPTEVFEAFWGLFAERQLLRYCRVIRNQACGNGNGMDVSIYV